MFSLCIGSSSLRNDDKHLTRSKSKERSNQKFPTNLTYISTKSLNDENDASCKNCFKSL